MLSIFFPSLRGGFGMPYLFTSSIRAPLLSFNYMHLTLKSTYTHVGHLDFQFCFGISFVIFSSVKSFGIWVLSGRCVK